MIRTLRFGARYEDFRSIEYVNDDDNPGFLRLIVTTSPYETQGEVLLWEGTSFDPPATAKKTDIQLQADTFDWLVPEALGFSHGGLAGQHKMDTSASPEERDQEHVPLSFGKTITDTTDLSDRYARNVETTTVTFDAMLSIANGGFSFTMDSRAEDRNYIAFLVVEEQMLQSKTWLHTTFMSPATGVVTHVPASFFAQEDKAKTLSDAISAEIGKHLQEVGHVVIGANPGPSELKQLQETLVQLNQDRGLVAMAKKAVERKAIGRNLQRHVGF